MAIPKNRYEYYMMRACWCLDKARSYNHKDEDLFKFYYNAFLGYKQKALRVDLNNLDKEV
jgi:hypothetical protein